MKWGIFAFAHFRGSCCCLAPYKIVIKTIRRIVTNETAYRRQRNAVSLSVKRHIAFRAIKGGGLGVLRLRLFLGVLNYGSDDNVVCDGTDNCHWEISDGILQPEYLYK